MDACWRDITEKEKENKKKKKKWFDTQLAKKHKKKWFDTCAEKNITVRN